MNEARPTPPLQTLLPRACAILGEPAPDLSLDPDEPGLLDLAQKLGPTMLLELARAMPDPFPQADFERLEFEELIGLRGAAEDLDDPDYACCRAESLLALATAPEGWPKRLAELEHLDRCQRIRGVLAELRRLRVEMTAADRRHASLLLRLHVACQEELAALVVRPPELTLV